MTDSTEKGMTMFRWRSTLLQWDILSENTTNERRKIAEKVKKMFRLFI